MRDSPTTSWDALVVGAGVAGAVVARRLAEGGFRVLLIDKEPSADVGRKVCGNAIGEDGLAVVSRYIESPKGAEVARRLSHGTLILEDGTAIRIPKGGVILNRLVFGQRILADAVEAGAVFRDRCSCLGWSDRRVNRVRIRDAEGAEGDVDARIVIDASGFRAVLTRTGGPAHPDAVSRDDVAVAYREIAPLRKPLDRPDDAIIVLTPKLARGGYGWVFPMGDRLANVGIGAPLAAVGRPIREIYDEFIASQPWLEATDPIEAGTGLLPIRAPLATFVGDGFMSVGDAACQTDPLHGGGISPSIVAANLAADSAAEALSDGDVSTTALWGYNVAFMREVGARHAGQDFLRRFLDSVSDDDLLFLAREFGSGHLLTTTFQPDGALPRLRTAFRFLAKAAARPRLAGALVRTGQLCEKIQEAYLDYPHSVGRFESWLGQVEFQRRALRRAVGGSES
jgi:digeranylgeranylglycerophospholipid reductase